MFPGLYGFLKVRSLVTYGSPPEAVNDLRALVKLLSETFNNRELLESTVRYVLSGLTKSPGDVAKALLSGDEDRFYMTLSELNDPALWKNCRKLLK
ncbi:MAG: hypothetical protein RMH84_00310 [Sulfolobales archaeon]|nr:hypothetical protein [Sulfolobales archaeon]MDW8010031.1 hypothetical protein [Sulfolobales archaeon]